jgi:biotin carboxylase
MQRALGELRIEGVPTTASFLARLLASEAFESGAMHTRYVEQFTEEQGP